MSEARVVSQANSHPTDEPRSNNGDSVHIAGYRDPDGEVTLHAFVDGKEVKSFEHIVDPGAGYPYPLSEWRKNLRELEVADMPDAVKTILIGYYVNAEDRYTQDDMYPARDMQPRVRDLDALDPALWINNGIADPDDANDDKGATDRAVLIEQPEVVEHWICNNTVRAGWALAALKAYAARKQGQLYQMPPELREHDEASHARPFLPVDVLTPEAAAVITYRQHVGGCYFTDTVAELLGALRHLADAKDIIIAEPIDEDTPHLHATLAQLINDIRDASTAAWSGALALTFDLLSEEAYESYLSEVASSR